jgi:FkbM family methyltransferase
LRNWPEMLRRCDMMRERFPDEPLGHALAGRALLELGRHAEAEEVLAAAAQRFPQDRDTLFNRALSALRWRDWVEAVTRSMQLVEHFPSLPFGYVYGGRALLEMGDYDRAEPLLAEATRRSPEDAGVFASWASRPERQQDWPEAARRWAQMRMRFPNHPLGYVRGAQALLEDGRFEEVERVFAEASPKFAHHRDLAQAQPELLRLREAARLGRIAAAALRRSETSAGNSPEPVKYVFRGHEQAGFFAHALMLGGSRELITPAHDNKPPGDEPYLCFVPVLDFWRMDRLHAEHSQVWHYSQVIEDRIVDDLRSRRALLVFDLCNEGPEFDREIFRQLLAYLDEKALPAAQVAWLAQNRVMQQHYLDAFGGARREHIRFEYYDFFIKSMAWTFATDNAELYGPDPDTFATQMFAASSKDKLLLCLNATPRIHRVLTVAELVHRDWVTSSLVSFPGLSYAKPGHTREDILEFVKHRPEFRYLVPALERAMSIQDLRVDKFEETGNALFDKIDPDPYLRTFFSLVTETEYTDGTVDRITEKAVKPFCLGHPTLIVGNPNATAFLQEFGFQDWSAVIDREYESEPNPAKRFRLLFGEVQRQISSIRRDPDVWLDSVREVGEANIEHAASGGFLATYVARYDRAIIDRWRAVLPAVAPGATAAETGPSGYRTPARFSSQLNGDFKSQWGQDRFIFENLMDFRNGTFLEVGAHDGVTLSNTYFFEKALQWRGILIEMLPWFFPEIAKRRPDSLCFNCALSAESMKQLFLDAGDRSGLLRYLDRREIEYLEEHYRDQEPKPTFNLHWIETRPLMDIIEESGFDRINYFSLDVEGAELPILKMIDFARVHIDVFSIEDNAAQHQWRAYDQMLKPHGYTCIGGLGVDGFFIHERFRQRLLTQHGPGYLTEICKQLQPFCG